MLAISKKETPDFCIVNILPCRINHDGITKVTKRHWVASSEADGTKTAHFRGRRLRGRRIALPDQYRGIVLKATNKIIIEPSPMVSEEDEESEMPDPIKIVDEVSSIQDMVIWGHDQVPASDNTFVRGVEEWITFAEAIHKK